jgi:uncharacterized Zn finger protein (UPF0148 family)
MASLLAPVGVSGSGGVTGVAGVGGTAGIGTGASQQSPCPGCGCTETHEAEDGYVYCVRCGQRISDARVEEADDIYEVKGLTRAVALKVDTGIDEVDELQDPFSRTELILSAFQEALRLQSTCLIRNHGCSRSTFASVGRLFSAMLELWHSRGWAPSSGSPKHAIIHLSARGLHHTMSKKQSKSATHTAGTGTGADANPGDMDGFVSDSDYSDDSEPDTWSQDLNAKADTAAAAAAATSSNANAANANAKGAYKPPLLAMHTSLAICYLASSCARDPVIAKDFVSWASQGTLPYNGILSHTQFSEPLRKRIERDRSLRLARFFTPTHVPSNSRLQFFADRLLKDLHSIPLGDARHPIHIPQPHFFALLNRFVIDLLLPSQLLPLAQAILDLWLCHKPGNIVNVMACLVLAVQLCYGLNYSDETHSSLRNFAVVVGDAFLAGLPNWHQVVLRQHQHLTRASANIAQDVSAMADAFSRPSDADTLSVVHQKAFLSYFSDHVLQGAGETRQFKDTLKHLHQIQAQEQREFKEAQQSRRHQRRAIANATEVRTVAPENTVASTFGDASSTTDTMQELSQQLFASPTHGPTTAKSEQSSLLSQARSAIYSQQPMSFDVLQYSGGDKQGQIPQSFQYLLQLCGQHIGVRVSSLLAHVRRLISYLQSIQSALHVP